MSDSRLPRREFIATGVGLAAAALTTSRAGAVSPNDKMNVGIVGCGVRGNYILGEAIAAGAGRINVVGICDVWKVARDKMAADLAGKHGMKPEPFARHQDLLALPGLDAVIIATPDHAHCAVLTDVVGAGKDAYVEKPLCAPLEDAIAAQRSNSSRSHGELGGIFRAVGAPTESERNSRSPPGARPARPRSGRSVWREEPLTRVAMDQVRLVSAASRATRAASPRCRSSS